MEKNVSRDVGADIFMFGLLQGTVSSSSEMTPSLLSYIGEPLKRVWTGITTFVTGGYEEVCKDIEDYEDIVVPGTERGTLVTYDLTYYLNDILFNDNDQTLYQYDKSGRDKASYTYANNTRVAGDLKKSAVRYVSKTAGDYSYLYDGLGNVVQDAKNGDISNSYEYDPFGAVVSGAEINDVLFTSNGEEYTEATGLQYLRARYLNTETGRFMSEDPYEGTTGNIMTQNRYAYAENDPVNRRDPGGHKSILKRIKSFAKKVVNRVKTVANRVIRAVNNAPKKSPSSAKSASHYSKVSNNTSLNRGRRSANIVQRYVTTKYKSAEQRAKDIRTTLKAKYDSLRKKVSCNKDSNPVKKVVVGIGDSLFDMGEGIYNIAKNPKEAIMGMVNAVKHPIKTGKAIIDDYKQMAKDKGKLYVAGRVVPDIVIALLGTKGADKAVKAITKTKKVTKAVDKIDDVSDAGKIISKVDDVVAEPILGRKIEYIMGNATGNIHNIERSLEMEKTLNSIGIFDNKAGRTLVKNAFDDAHANIDKGVLDHRTGRTSVDTLLS